MKLRKIFKKREKTLQQQINDLKFGFYLVVLLCLFICGGMINMGVVAKNNGKMPVYSSWHYEDETHFTFQNKSEVNLFYFTDIFRIKNAYFSIGDLVMFFTGMIIFSMSLFKGFKTLGESRKAKNEITSKPLRDFYSTSIF